MITLKVTKKPEPQPFSRRYILGKTTWRGVRLTQSFKRLKLTLDSGQNPVYTVKILISEQIAFPAVAYFGQVFVVCRLINKSVLE